MCSYLTYRAKPNTKVFKEVKLYNTRYKAAAICYEIKTNNKEAMYV